MSYTQKISVVGLFLVALCALSVVTPAEARERRQTSERSGQATSTPKMEAKERSSSRKMEDKMSSSTPKVDAACMQTAVENREIAITGAWTTFTSAIVSALESRKTALYSAWGMSDAKARGAAIKTTATTWKSANKKAHEELRKSRGAAWETFKKTAKDSCKMPVPKEESLGTEAKDTIQI